ncbi:hypothetical protein AF335_22705 [Streptomyces eurocidicus]|uniref:Uncharacterized protein n=1 Tax=Streptomyces eurocidicus TaxID=66423 RepID=A0A2N8NSD6_STREU|nr:hypothetical protein [Streptomyces eurocidicus]MBB5121585.1 hypothetical protein [Streptomyces eurocidicus]MBF6054771.1 hypothetical protein [Streptomyces eurocidicus]PNE31674.1 hypothetical protein AF335_22705 [Streptomyces eurocidicus]
MNALPPPPPPAHIRTWPDRPALLADRARAIGGLVHAQLAPRRLLLLWLLTALTVLGWVFAVLGLEAVADGGTVRYLHAAAFLALAGCAAVPSVLGIASGLRKDRRARERLRLWTSLDRDPYGDQVYRAAGLTWFWLLMSLLPAAVAAVVACAYVAEVFARPPGETAGTTYAYAVGFTAPLAAAGAQGVGKALAHRRWARGMAEAAAGTGPRHG